MYINKKDTDIINHPDPKQSSLQSGKKEKTLIFSKFQLRNETKWNKTDTRYRFLIFGGNICFTYHNHQEL